MNKLPRRAPHALGGWVHEHGALRWVGEQGVVRVDVIGWLLEAMSAGPGAARLPHDEHLAEVLEGWSRLGLIRSHRFLADSPPVAWLTASGLRAAGLEFRSRRPVAHLLNHAHGVSAVRLGIERANRGAGWVCERELARHGARSRPLGGAHIPDGVFVAPTGVVVAVEVELSVKRAPRLRSIIEELVASYELVLYVCRGRGVTRAVDAAREAVGGGHRVLVESLDWYDPPGHGRPPRLGEDPAP